MKYKKLICFDFDKTLCNTMEPEEGRIIWKEKTGEEYPHKGWWGRAESLNTDIFDVSLNEWTYNKYLNAVSDSNNYVMLATGRLETNKTSLRREVEIILNKFNLSFDSIHLNDSGDTYYFKRKLFERLITEINPEEFVMYDDREEHLIKFREWAKDMKCVVRIIDVINRVETIINK